MQRQEKSIKNEEKRNKKISIKSFESGCISTLCKNMKNEGKI